MYGKSDWNYINFSQKHEINYNELYSMEMKTYYFEINDDNKNLFKQYGEEAKEYFGKKSNENLTHKEFYEFMNYKGYKKVG